MTKKNQPHTRCAGVKATAPGARKVSVLRSRPCHPRKFHLPNAANRRPMPPSSAISDRTLHITAFAVTRFPTSGSGGQLLVYE